MQMDGVSDGRVNDGQPIGEQQEQFDELLQQVGFEATSCLTESNL
jgi:hypothetical protein